MAFHSGPLLTNKLYISAFRESSPCQQWVVARGPQLVQQQTHKKRGQRGIFCFLLLFQAPIPSRPHQIPLLHLRLQGVPLTHALVIVFAGGLTFGVPVADRSAEETPSQPSAQQEVDVRRLQEADGALARQGSVSRRPPGDRRAAPVEAAVRRVVRDVLQQLRQPLPAAAAAAPRPSSVPRPSVGGRPTRTLVQQPRSARQPDGPPLTPVPLPRCETLQGQPLAVLQGQPLPAVPVLQGQPLSAVSVRRL